MAIQLVIRDNLQGHEATFRPGDTRVIEGPVVRIGTRSKLECILPRDSGLPDLAATLALEGPTGTWTLTPEAATPVYLNQEAATEAQALRSGDEIRVGHWTLRFHKVMPRVRYARRSDFLGTFAKMLVAAILVAEIGVVSWLPRQVQRAQLWELQIARQRTVMLLDELRQDNAKAKAVGTVEQAARKMLGDQLDRLAFHLRRNQDALTREQWRGAHATLLVYQENVQRLRGGAIFPETPPLDLNGAVHGVLTR